MQINPQAVLSFWFEEIQSVRWWEQSPEFDQMIAQRFGDLQRSAAACELFTWRETPKGRLAEIVVLDQFSRNIHRNKAQAFANDSLALALAQTAISIQADLALDIQLRAFMYMPFMHSESRHLHAFALNLFDVKGLESFLHAERKHKAIIDRFGRYPHRNVILGRTSTIEEIEFLSTS